jgi:hypothetical protein
MSQSASKRCVVAYATRDEQFLWNVYLPAQGTVADALRAARDLAEREAHAPPDVPWDDASVGIFGQVCSRSEIPAEGDRIEIYRPLAADPRERRRQAVRTQRREARQRRS